MNHICKGYSSGIVFFKGHTWETRQGGFRRTALLIGNGAWPVKKEKRLVNFLLDRGFRVIAPELAYGAAGTPRAGLPAFRQAIDFFIKEEADPRLPLYLIASSCSSGALLPVLASMANLTAVALVGPVVDFPPPGAKKTVFFLPALSLELSPETISGEPKLVEGIAPPRIVLKFRAGDLKILASELKSVFAKPLGLPVAAFCGEDDPLIGQTGRAALAAGGIRVFGYPRVRREPGWDKYSDNYYADLGSFLDQAESGSGKKQ